MVLEAVGGWLRLMLIPSIQDEEPMPELRGLEQGSAS